MLSLLHLLKRARIQWYCFKWRRFLTAGKNFTFGRGTIFYARDSMAIGDNVYFGRYCNVETDLEVGNCVLISNNVAFIGKYDHDPRQVGTPTRCSISVRDMSFSIPLEDRKITIGDDVWIGFGAIIYSGVRIGEGAVIAAGSVVTSDVEAFTMAAGVPARKVADRFNAADRQKHIDMCRERYGCFKR